MKIKFPTYEIELSIEELKELLVGINKPRFISPSHSSNKPSIEHVSIAIPLPKKVVKPNSQKLSIEQIKQIKTLAEDGLSNNQISERLKISQQLINYWRKNTPREINETP